MEKNLCFEFFVNGCTSTSELLGQFIDVVEDFLDDRGVQLKSERTLPTREDSCCCSEGALIHGADYDHLHDLFFDTLNNWSSSDEDSGVDFFIVDGILTSDRRLLKYATTDPIEVAHISKIGTVFWREDQQTLTRESKECVLSTAKLVRHRFEEKLSELSGEIGQCAELLLAIDEVLPDKKEELEKEALSRLNDNTSDENAVDFLKEQLLKALDVRMLEECIYFASNWYSKSFYLKCQDEKTTFSIKEKIETLLPKHFDIFDVGRFRWLGHIINTSKVKTSHEYITNIEILDLTTIKIEIQGEYFVPTTNIEEFLEIAFPKKGIVVEEESQYCIKD